MENEVFRRKLPGITPVGLTGPGFEIYDLGLGLPTTIFWAKVN